MTKSSHRAELALLVPKDHLALQEPAVKSVLQGLEVLLDRLGIPVQQVPPELLDPLVPQVPQG